MRGLEDSEWIRLRGVVATYRDDGTRVVMEVLSDYGTFDLEFPNKVRPDGTTNLIGREIIATGACSTVYDGRVKLAREAVDTLKGHFKEALFEPIRRSTKLAEAPSHRQTIFEYAADSHGAEDYRTLVERFIAAATGPGVAATKVGDPRGREAGAAAVVGATPETLEERG
jgi:hypothetical protein